ncbi:MAG: hypothetical protein RL653_1255 [Pseudomonadota bacterium]|jgi:hypothetical protein
MGAAFAAPKDSKDAPAGKVPAEKTRVVRSVGTCKVDADCELVFYAPHCCQRTCGRRAVGKEQAAQSRLPKDCPEERAGRCPPSAPCSREDRDEPVAAVCQGGVCSTVFKAR